MIFWTLTQADADRLDMVDAHAILSPLETEKFHQMKFPKRRREWLLGRYAAKQLLRGCVKEAQKIPQRSISILNRPEGAPYFDLPGMDTSPIVLSISHRDEMALCALSTDARRLGVDIERIEPRAEVFIEDYFTQGEKAFAAGLSARGRVVWATAAWSLKEAALKALSLGLRVDTRKVEVDFCQDPADFDSQAGDWALTQVLTQIGGEKFSAYWKRINGYVLTMAIDRVQPLDLNASFCPINPI